MVQMLGTLSTTRKTAIKKKSVIELVTEESDSESDSSDSAFEKRPSKKAKKVKVDKKFKKSVKKPVTEKKEHLSVASSVSTPEKKLMAQARKSLEGRMISYPCQ
eukprot:12919556-Ditylum_brightwellii.AAC.1